MDKLEYENIILEIYIESTSIKIQPHHWGGGRQISMEGVALEYFNNDNIIRYADPPYSFYS